MIRDPSVGDVRGVWYEIGREFVSKRGQVFLHHTLLKLEDGPPFSRIDQIIRLI